MEKSYFTSRYHLYGGSPKQLIFIENANDIAQQLRKIGGTIELCLQTHAKMLNIIDFFPEFNIVGANEIIPGLKSSPKDNGGLIFHLFSSFFKKNFFTKISRPVGLHFILISLLHLFFKLKLYIKNYNDDVCSF